MTWDLIKISARLVLASRSPRRKMLLASIGLSPRVQPVDIDETPTPGEEPRAYALRVAIEKASAAKPDEPGLVLAADTVVDLAGEILGKPKDDPEAAAMLQKLSGQTHAVHTAIVARDLRPADATWVGQAVITTQVRFRRLTDIDIDRYIKTGEPRDKAGAYGIQGEGAVLVDRIDGSYTNVIGLPLAETMEMIERAG